MGIRIQNLKDIYYFSNLDPIPNPDLLFLSAFGTDDCFDETETFDPFLNLDLGNFIEEVFSKPPDKTDVAREYAVPDVEQLPPLLPSLVPNTMLSSRIS